MKSTVARRLAIACVFVLAPGLAQAYIGPGLGAGAIAAALGVIGSLFLAVFAVVYYPIKRMRKKRRAEAEAKDPTATPSE